MNVRIFLLVCMAIFTILTVLNLRTYIRYRTSPFPTLLSFLLFLFTVILYIGKMHYAFLVLLSTVLIAIFALPNAWKDWVKVLRQKDVNPEERIRLRDILGWELYIKLGYRFGVRKASFLYALNYSTIFVIGYCVLEMLLSLEYSFEVALIAGVLIMPISYRLARKTIGEFVEVKR